MNVAESIENLGPGDQIFEKILHNPWTNHSKVVPPPQRNDATHPLSSSPELDIDGWVHFPFFTTIFPSPAWAKTKPFHSTGS